MLEGGVVKIRWSINPSIFGNKNEKSFFCLIFLLYSVLGLLLFQSAPYPLRLRHHLRPVRRLRRRAVQLLPVPHALELAVAIDDVAARVHAVLDALQLQRVPVLQLRQRVGLLHLLLGELGLGRLLRDGRHSRGQRVLLLHIQHRGLLGGVLLGLRRLAPRLHLGLLLIAEHALGLGLRLRARYAAALRARVLGLARRRGQVLRRRPLLEGLQDGLLLHGIGILVGVLQVLGEEGRDGARQLHVALVLLEQRADAAVQELKVGVGLRRGRVRVTLLLGLLRLCRQLHAALHQSGLQAGQLLLQGRDALHDGGGGCHGG